MVEVEGNLIDASMVLRQKESMISGIKNNTKQLEQ